MLDRISGEDKRNLSKASQKEVSLEDTRKRNTRFTGVSEASASDKNKATDSSRKVMWQDVLDNAKPVLPEGVKKHLDTIIKYHEEGSQNKPSDTEYIEAYKQALKKWCPEIWKEYENVKKFATDGKWDYAKSKSNSKSKDGKCTFYLPPKATYPIDILLRGVDETLTMKYDNIFLKSHQHSDADFEEQVNITAKTLEMNMELDNMVWKVNEEYPLAYQHKKDYKGGIRQAFENGSINENTLKDEVRQIGYNYAREQLRERNKPKNGAPDIFLNTQPGSYFREWDKFKKMKKEVQLKEPLQLAKYELVKLDKNGPIQISDDNRTFSMKEPVKLGSDDNRTFSMKEPVKLGSDECKVLLSFLEARTTEGGTEGTLKVAILPNKEIWVLPYYFSEGEKTAHSIAARGNPVVWAGEVDLVIDGEGNMKVTQLKGDSGHYLTYNSDPEKQKAIFQFAVSTFTDHGCSALNVKDVSLMGLNYKENRIVNEAEIDFSR